MTRPAWQNNTQITCPYCNTESPYADFDVSCADECFCPNCHQMFVLEHDEDEEEE